MKNLVAMILLAISGQTLAEACEQRIKNNVIVYELSREECAFVSSRQNNLIMRVRRHDHKVIDEEDESSESIWLAISQMEEAPDLAAEYSGLVPVRRSGEANIYKVKTREVWIFKGLDGQVVQGGQRLDKLGGMRAYKEYFVFYVAGLGMKDVVELDKEVLGFFQKIGL